MRLIRKVIATAALLAAASTSMAANFVVDAKNNSSTGGTGLGTIVLNLGQAFTVSVSPTDLWNAGPLPRWSNADGLVVDLFATGSDESTAAAGTKIGQSFSNWSQGGLSAPYGSLVGQIDGGNYFKIGTNYAGNAGVAGTLKLFYWDSNASDNTQWITANVTAVPEPTTGALLLAGMGVIGFIARRRKV